jgi:hypothetical protein
MPWESRNGRGRYYTQSYREGNRVRRRYIGQGPYAAQIAQADAFQKRRLNDAKLELREAENQIRQVESRMKDFHDSVELLSRASLIAAGYHRHDRGEWRKRRG